MPSRKNDNAGVDGRRLRRERGRAAVIDAMFDLLRDGRMTPRSDELAARAGVSEASIFRYFDSLDDLVEEAIAAFLARYSSTLEIPRAGQGDRAERVAAFVRSRVRFYEATAPILAAGRARATHVGRPAMIEPGLEVRSDQVRVQFATELAGASATRQEDLVASIDTCASADSWDTLREHFGRGREQIRRMWVRNIEAIIDRWDCQG